MSVGTADPRRPRRISAADGGTVSTATRNAAEATHERFRRSLRPASATQRSGSRVDAAAADDGGTALVAALHAPSWVVIGDLAVDQQAQGLAGATPPGADSPRPGTLDLGTTDDDQSARRAWHEAMVELLQRLCFATDHSMTQWTAVVPLESTILPQTTLHISFSPQRLRLRFHTDAASSLRVLSDSAQSLAQSLKEALPDVTDIGIEIT